MTRREGIIKRYKEPENKKIAEQAGTISALLSAEYENYVQLCHYCYEEPKQLNEWLNETINPIKE